MAKRRKDTRAKQVDDVRTIDQPKPRLDDILGRFVPPPCPACQTVELPNRRKTFVNGTHTTNTPTEMIIERSIKCPHCGYVRMDYERIKHKYLLPVLHSDGVNQENNELVMPYLEHGISSISTSTD